MSNSEITLYSYVYFDEDDEENIYYYARNDENPRIEIYSATDFSRLDNVHHNAGIKRYNIRVQNDGSQILAIWFQNEFVMLYQKLNNGRFVELISRENQTEQSPVLLNPDQDSSNDVNRIKQINYLNVQGQNLTPLDDDLFENFENDQSITLDSILEYLNGALSLIQNELMKKSYETLLKQLYGLQVTLLEFLIVDGLQINFISFDEASEMLKRNEIYNSVINPLLQPFAGPPSSSNRIITLFHKNGTTYLLKAKYNSNKTIDKPI